MTKMSDDNLIDEIETITGGEVLRSDLGGYYISHSDKESTCDYPTVQDLYNSLQRSEGYLVVYGNPVDGLRFVGPFGTHEEACEYADVDNPSDEWWIAELEVPNDGQ